MSIAVGLDELRAQIDEFTTDAYLLTVSDDGRAHSVAVAVGEETERVVRGIADLGRRVPVPQGVPWYPQDLDAWSVRWVLMHLVSETARHTGHADIVREAVDGATAFPLLAAAEGWPATPWLQPWAPE